MKLRSKLQIASLADICASLAWTELAFDSSGTEPTLPVSSSLWSMVECVETETSSLQRAYLNGAEMGDTTCNLYLESDFQGLDVEHFQACLKGQLFKHAALRIRFAEGGHLQQALAPTEFDDWVLPVTDLRTVPENDRYLQEIREACKAVEKGQQKRMWDVRAALLPRDKVRLFLRIELIALDAGSILHLAKELDALYGRQKVPAGPDLFASAMQANCKRLQAVPGRWAQITVPKPPQIPRRTTAEAPSFQRVWASLDSPTTRQLLALCRDKNITPTACITCCFQDVLRNHVGKDKDFTLKHDNYKSKPHRRCSSYVGKCSCW